MTLGNDHRNESKTLVQSILASRVQPRKVECTREVFYVLAPTNRFPLRWSMEYGDVKSFPSPSLYNYVVSIVRKN